MTGDLCVAGAHAKGTELGVSYVVTNCPDTVISHPEQFQQGTASTECDLGNWFLFYLVLEEGSGSFCPSKHTGRSHLIQNLRPPGLGPTPMWKSHLLHNYCVQMSPQAKCSALSRQEPGLTERDPGKGHRHSDCRQPEPLFCCKADDVRLPFSLLPF